MGSFKHAIPNAVGRSWNVRQPSSFSGRSTDCTDGNLVKGWCRGGWQCIEFRPDYINTRFIFSSHCQVHAPISLDLQVPNLKCDAYCKKYRLNKTFHDSWIPLVNVRYQFQMSCWVVDIYFFNFTWPVHLQISNGGLDAIALRRWWKEIENINLTVYQRNEMALVKWGLGYSMYIYIMNIYRIIQDRERNMYLHKHVTKLPKLCNLKNRFPC